MICFKLSQINLTNNNDNMKTKILTISVLLSGVAANAQTTGLTDRTFWSPQFFIAILAGLVLALAFQVVLTALSVAAGISAIGDVRKTYVESRVDPDTNKAKDNHSFDQDYKDNDMITSVKVTAGFGIWSLLTTSISLFGASALALNLNYFGSTFSSLTVGLVIWGLFFLILFYLEAKVVHTVVGGLAKTAISGLKSSAGMVKQFFETSESSKLENTLNNVVDKVRKDFDTGNSTEDLSEVLSNFLTKMDKKLPSYETVKNDLSTLIKEGKTKNNSTSWMAIQQILTKALDTVGNSADSESKGKAAKLKQIFSELKEAYSSDEDTIEGVKGIVAEHTSLEKEQINEKISSIKNRISEATPDSLSIDQLKQDFNEILSDPSTIKTVLSSKFEGLNRKSIIQTLSENSKLDKEQLETYAQNIEDAIDSVKEKLNNLSLASIKEKAERSISGFLNSTDRSELRYDSLKRDVTKILDNPKDSLTVIKNRVAKFDGDTVKALITNNKYISEDKIDELTAKVEESIQTVRNKVTEIETRARQEWEMAKRKAVIQAEHVRKTAASAAWWLVITAVVSAGAAMLGGYIEWL